MGGDESDNSVHKPPFDGTAGYSTLRKHGDDHPRSTVTFKAAGFKLDTKYNRVRLSKGDNTKDYWSDFILCGYQTRPDGDLPTVENATAIYSQTKQATGRSKTRE